MSFSETKIKLVYLFCMVVVFPFTQEARSIVEPLGFILLPVFTEQPQCWHELTAHMHVMPGSSSASSQYTNLSRLSFFFFFTCAIPKIDKKIYIICAMSILPTSPCCFSVYTCRLFYRHETKETVLKQSFFLFFYVCACLPLRRSTVCGSLQRLHHLSCSHSCGISSVG